ncbi:cytochrome b [Legionella pneumophila]|uniref:Cytochrome b561 transmembrane protein n=1 Tax=Legionella pneumophila subsp. pascullei TaxID=91890 RepID=A0AAX2IVC6_LEGPN|nr:cytochrome b [Legionella pneumophila]AMP89703.1 cytochrome b [Legionella pneumophila subsp. pascullei]AMP92631.1 cytochrome B [Legionella pneumophila subsp. pascullei]AMP95596.1 cytochrome B [Legionella pneumophila subsp. pascullei]SQG90506.1 cytochrome b561 transmembrane protein [Legionella pneumophila subsp. pascullei]VEH06846.1 cytochrome b561 transmembrane protein [Legionella pneumophila subsp. pascullei]
MQIRNTSTKFGLVMIFFHWIMAVLIIGLLGVGLYMVRLPFSLEKLKLYGWHKEYGFLVLFLAFFRLIWRLTNQLPELAIPLLEKITARSMHWAFYFFMFAMPISGWLITSAAGLPASFFGLFVLPNLVSSDESNRILFQWIHECLGYALITAIFLHTAAALKHHFINRDDILRRML